MWVMFLFDVHIKGYCGQGLKYVAVLADIEVVRVDGLVGNVMKVLQVFFIEHVLAYSILSLISVAKGQLRIGH